MSSFRRRSPPKENGGQRQRTRKQMIPMENIMKKGTDVAMLSYMLETWSNLDMWGVVRNSLGPTELHICILYLALTHS